MIRFVATKTCVLFPLFLMALGAVTAFGGSDRATPKDPHAELEGALKELEEWNRIMASVEDEAARKAYEERKPEVVPWVEESGPPNPDNAALLYYQAFLLRPEPNMAVNEKIHDMFSDGEPDRQVRTYLGYCLPMIQVTEIASRMPHCTWGIWNGPGSRFGAKELRSEVNHVWNVLLVDARTLVADGHYRTALERCLTVRRLARHLSEDTRLHLIARTPDFMALRTIQHVLGIMPPDADILTWFGGHLALVPAVPVSFAETLEWGFKSTLQRMRTDPALLAKLREQLVEKAEDEQAKERARNLTDEQLLSRGREPYTRFLDSILRVLAGEMTYEQRYAEMQRLYRKFVGEYGTDPVVAHVIAWCATDTVIVEQYPRYVGHKAHFNGLRAAIEVYLILAKTGKLPEKLPEHLPKDPFTGRDFGYERTDEGFALRCQGKESPPWKDLEFKVRRQD